MDSVNSTLKILFVASSLFAASGARFTSSSAAAAAAAKSAYCVDSPYRQFDFWVGDWDVFDIDKPTIKVARVHVERILNGCVLREDYAGADGYKGQSFSIFDASRQVWHQSWVTNHGQLLTIEGTLQAGDMLLSGVDHTSDGKERHVRGVWKPVAGGVREIATRSTDGELTWQPWFDLLFRPHQP